MFCVRIIDRSTRWWISRVANLRDNNMIFSYVIFAIRHHTRALAPIAYQMFLGKKIPTEFSPPPPTPFLTITPTLAFADHLVGLGRVEAVQHSPPLAHHAVELTLAHLRDCDDEVGKGGECVCVCEALPWHVCLAFVEGSCLGSDAQPRVGCAAKF